MLIIKPDELRFRLTWLAQRLFMLPMVWLVYRLLNEVEVEGLEHLSGLDDDPRPIILAPNHTTAWDSWTGCVWALSSRRRFASRTDFTCVLAAPENVPTKPLKLLVSTLGAIPVDRERGVEQEGLQDTLRLMREGKRRVVVTCYPEGTRSDTGRMRRKGKAGIGWLAEQTGAVVVPIHHVGVTRMPGLGMRMKLRIGRPMTFEHHKGAAGSPFTWREITKEIMAALHAMEDAASAPPAQRRARRRAELASRRLASRQAPLDRREHPSARTSAASPAQQQEPAGR